MTYLVNLTNTKQTGQKRTSIYAALFRSPLVLFLVAPLAALGIALGALKAVELDSKLGGHWATVIWLGLVCLTFVAIYLAMKRAEGIICAQLGSDGLFCCPSCSCRFDFWQNRGRCPACPPAR